MNAITEKIYLDLLKKISQKEISPGEILPTEKELAKQYNTTRMNAYFAVKQLEKEGIVIRRKKRGTILRSDFLEETLLKLKNQKSRCIHIFLPSTEKERQVAYIHWDHTTISEVEKNLKEKGYKVIFQETPNDKNKLKESLRNVLEEGASFLIFFPLGKEMEVLKENYGFLHSYPSEIFMINRGTHPPFEFPCHTLNISPYQEGYVAGEYIKKKGYKKIIFIYKRSSKDSYWLKERIKGLKTSIGIREIEIELEVKEDKEIKNEIKTIKETKNIIIVAQTDQVGGEIIDFLKTNEISIPEDLHVLSFDNDPRFRKYNLTTVAAEVSQISKLLGSMISAIEKKYFKGATLSINIASQVIERTTTGKGKN